MTTDAESVEIMDDGAQKTWADIADAGVGELASAYVLSAAIVGLARSGIARQLSNDWGPLVKLVPNAALAPRLEHVLRFLALRGVVESNGDSWRTTLYGAKLFDEVAESALGYYVDAYGPVLQNIGGLLNGSLTYGRDVSRDTEALGQRCEVLFRSFGSRIVQESLRASDARTVLDLGCGTGGMLLDLVLADPGLRGFGIDIAPDAIAYAERRADEKGVADRLSFVTADAFQPETWPDDILRTCDFYIAVGALHEHFRDGEGAVIDLMRRYGDLLRRNENRILLLCEPEMTTASKADANFYLIHALTDQGFPRPRGDWMTVIEASGLNCRRILSVPNTAFRFAYYEITAS